MAKPVEAMKIPAEWLGPELSGKYDFFSMWLEALKDGVKIPRISLNIQTGIGTTHPEDENGLMIDENDCFVISDFEFDTVRLRRDAPPLARDLFRQYAEHWTGKTKVRLEL